jgi:hypothetical protein
VVFNGDVLTVDDGVCEVVDVVVDDGNEDDKGVEFGTVKNCVLREAFVVIEKCF